MSDNGAMLCLFPLKRSPLTEFEALPAKHTSKNGRTHRRRSACNEVVSIPHR